MDNLILKTMIDEYKFCCDYLRSVVKEEETYLRSNEKRSLFCIEKHFSDSSAFLISFCPWCGKKLTTKAVVDKDYEVILEKKNEFKSQKFDKKISEGLRREILKKHYEHLKRLKFFGFTDRLTLCNFKFEIYWVIIEEAYFNFTVDEIRKKIQVNEEEIKKILNYEIDDLNLEKLIIYARRLVPDLWIEVIKKEKN